MKKFLILLVCVFTALAVTDANANVRRVQATVQGGLEMVGFTTGSLATNAIDTLEVGPVCVKARQLALGSAVADTTASALQMQGYILSFALEGLSGTGGSGTVDSMQVGIDVSWDGQNWTQISALGNLMTNTLANKSVAFKTGTAQPAGLKDVPAFFRFRYKNTGAATGKANVMAAWQTQCLK